MVGDVGPGAVAGAPVLRDERLNALVADAKFDERAEELWRPSYPEGKGRPSLPPGVYFRMLLIGYFEGLDSERGIAWRCADSLVLRAFLGFALDESTPDHSSLCRIRQRLDVEVHDSGVPDGSGDPGAARPAAREDDRDRRDDVWRPARPCAALRSIVRRDDGTAYDEFLAKLAKESGIETPTRSDLAKIDKKHKGKGSNDDWKRPHDPDAQITKMKDGRTHLARKSEQAVDMDSGAILAVTLHRGAAADSHTLSKTMLAACEHAMELGQGTPEEWVADKGYHCNDTMELMDGLGMRGYISEPDRGKRKWKDKEAARRGPYANRRRIRGGRGRRLMRQRVERSFAHCLEMGRMRRTWLRGHANILKRYLVLVAAFNLGIVMRQILGARTPRGLAALQAVLRQLFGLARSLKKRINDLLDNLAGFAAITLRVRSLDPNDPRTLEMTPFLQRIPGVGQQGKAIVHAVAAPARIDVSLWPFLSLFGKE